MPQNILFNRVLDIALVLTILYLIAVKNTYAYIDPGSGSYLLQIIAAGLLSSIFIIKKFWRNIKKRSFSANKFFSSFLKKTNGEKSR